MSKELQKEIMKRSKLKNKYSNKRNYKSCSLYKKQRNYCLTLLRETRKKAYFEKLNIKEIGDNKTFWKKSDLKLWYSYLKNRKQKITNKVHLK